LNKREQTHLEQALRTFLEFSKGDSLVGTSDNRSHEREGHQGEGVSALSSVRVFFAPGRVNLIGEHTDYNGGYVLPAALDMGTWLFVRERADKRLRIHSTTFPKIVELPIDNLHYSDEDDYANYPKGVLYEFQRRGFDLPGLDLLFYGNMPNGAGLSSSASIEVVTAFMLNTLLGANLNLVDLALMSQTAENQFVGVNCGIMDQFAVALGKQRHAISLNCNTLGYQLVPMALRDVTLVITNTNKRRGLADSKYNERRSECEAALGQIQRARPDVGQLTDIDVADWSELSVYIDNETLQKRARHVVFENERAKRAVSVLSSGNTAEFGRMMNLSHESLRDDYEVTGRELDVLAEVAWGAKGCIGSRMTGAGFGGCTVSLVESDKVDTFISSVRTAYSQQIGYEPSFYVTAIGDGVKEVTEQILGD
jgi:galactokinase